MSSGSALVRLEDGTIKWTVYSGTSDILSALLFDTADEAFDNLPISGLVPIGELLVFGDEEFDNHDASSWALRTLRSCLAFWYWR